MKFQNHIINYERTDAHTHARTDGQAQSNMPLQLFQSLEHNNLRITAKPHAHLQTLTNNLQSFKYIQLKLQEKDIAKIVGVALT